ncbi:EscU/YscU/HrcU family type III secretion system export apparatus switch protein [Acidimangrovimonas sediminis]|uniref:EscU/YscU/HrcU family type III secretion system export apparatus switch protein n=1 Tax=Acidimangrovimonas sediminis TaxID=2056283 RepID=UPI000C80F3E6|nr:flagellar type III secretion system protein FlhB [Acidimangrovimonas sediminis]
MAEDTQDQGSKTEQPTEKKLREARKQGDVPSSRELGALMAFLALFAIVVFALPRLAGSLAETLGTAFSAAGQVEVGTGNSGLTDVGRILGHYGLSVGLPLLPVLGGMVFAALFGVLIQGETVVAVERIRPKPEKLSPLAGLKRIYSGQALIEFAKSVAKVLVIGALALWITRNAVRDLWQGPGLDPEALPAYMAHFAGLLLAATAAFLLPVAVADIVWKRLSWLKKQRMTLKELRDEHKEQEGDPQLKAKRQQIQRRRARQRAARAVPTASVILTNPTHFAVALRYEMGRDHAPVCVAKGADLMARHIRHLARDHDIPVIENKPLARLLHARVEIDQTVPVEHWQAVAEIIGYVMDLRRNIRRKPPAGSELRRDD